MSKKALFITSNAGIEHDELSKPKDFLTSKGIEVIHAAIEREAAITVKGDKNQHSQFEPDTTLADVNYQDYDVLVIAGGTVNADTLRIDKDAQKIIQHFADEKKIIAAICHAPWTLIDAERIKGKYLTSYHSIKLDLENAGAHWRDETVHVCKTDGWPLITSRCPDDIPDFNQAILQQIEESTSAS